jgi:signal transduction histidine kinase
MTEDSQPAGQARLRLCDFIRSQLPTILARWEQTVRSLPVASPLSARRLLDHMPEVLETIASFTQTAHTGGRASMSGPPEVHALGRLDEGYDLAAVTMEYAVLRTCVLRLYREQNGAEVPLEEVERFCCAIDEAIRLSVARYTQARERTLIALDRIAEAALASDDVEKFLHELLRVLLETTASVDSAVILLREGELLRVNATVGLEDKVPEDFRLKVGEGFAGRAAAELRPIDLHAGQDTSILQDEPLRPRGTRALYGVPLLDGEKLVGVAVVGSRTAFEFSATDKLLIRTAAHRATAFITRAQLSALKRAARREAQEARTRLETIVQQLPAGVAIAVAPSGKLVVGNAAFERIWGQPFVPASAIPEYPRHYRGYRLDGRPYAPDEWPLSRALLNGEIVTGEEIIIERRDGTRRHVLHHAAPLRDPEGAIQAAVVTLVDITDLKQAQEEAHRAEDFRERFLGIVSHDLRNPLSAIIASAGFLLDDESLNGRQLRPVQRIARSADRMARMIADLLDFTRGRLGGGIPLSRQPATNLRHICRHVVDELEASHPGRELRLTAEGHFVGEWDADRLAQVIGNLGKNALDYSPEGTPVDFRLHDEGTALCLEVHNQGAPIPEDRLTHLFEPFRRASQDESRPSPGLGLGLYIVQQIVQAHGGTIEVRSTVADGTTFTVRLPRTGEITDPQH